MTTKLFFFFLAGEKKGRSLFVYNFFFSLIQKFWLNCSKQMGMTKNDEIAVVDDVVAVVVVESPFFQKCLDSFNF